MANVFTNIFSIKELRDRLIFTLLLLAVFRIGANIPVPGINTLALLKAVTDISGKQNFFEMINLFTGGALGQFAIFALGIMPYISSSIIMQLLKVVLPSLDKLSKEGSYGQKKIEMYTKYGTLVLCIIQAIGLLFLFEKQILSSHPNGVFIDELGTYINIIPNNEMTISFRLMFILTTTTGTMFLLWMGERITEKGISNGVSLLIFAGIVARLPVSIKNLVTGDKFAAEDSTNVIMLVVIFVIFAIIVGLVVAENMATRKIPVQYAKRVIGNRMYGAQSTHIPFKINPAGVMAIIFASSVILFPTQIIGFIGAGGQSTVLMTIANHLSPGKLTYVIFYMLLVIFFAYFYTIIIFNPVDIADRLKKEGGFIPGIRPGQHTSGYLSKVLNRITLPGSIFIGFVAVFPDIIMQFVPILQSERAFAYLMGGTSLLIMVGVGLEVSRQIESHLLTRHMDGFMKKTKLKGR